MTKIYLKRVNDAVHLEGRNEVGNIVNMDGSPDIGGENKGARPTEILLMAFGGCTSMDVIMILKKQKQIIDDYQVTVEGEREKVKEAKPFKKIHIHFALKGVIDENKLNRAIQLSIEKYCSVAMTLDKSVEITHSYSINEK